MIPLGKGPSRPDIRPMRLRLTPIALVLALLHVSIGLRLLIPFGPEARTVGAAALFACFWWLPKGWHVRDDRRPWAVLLPWITMGFFSWLLVLTAARDVSVAALALVVAPEVLDAWIRAPAIAVMALVPAITAAGFLMARRVATVKDVEVRLPGLPVALEGFTIAQISDIHVGPTIKREFVQGIVDRVNRLEADAVAITGHLLDGRVRELAHHTEPLGDLLSRHGTYVVTGNHEYYSGAGAWIG